MQGGLLEYFQRNKPTPFSGDATRSYHIIMCLLFINFNKKLRMDTEEMAAQLE